MICNYKKYQIEVVSDGVDGSQLFIENEEHVGITADFETLSLDEALEVGKSMVDGLLRVKILKQQKEREAGIAQAAEAA